MIGDEFIDVCRDDVMKIAVRVGLTTIRPEMFRAPGEVSVRRTESGRGVETIVGSFRIFAGLYGKIPASRKLRLMMKGSIA